MALLSMNEMTTYRWSFEEDVEQYAAAGFDGIGVWRHKLSDFGEEKGIELLRDCNLRVSSLMWGGGFTGSDGRGYQDAVDDALEAVRLAAALEAPSLIVYSGGRGGHTLNHARRLVKNALLEVAELAAQHQVTLALEPMHPACAAEWTFLTSLDDALAMIESVGSPQLKLALDAYHLGPEPQLVERLPHIAPLIGLVQLGDGRHCPGEEQDRCRLGEGVLPLRAIVETLTAAGYDGAYEIELIGEEIEASDYQTLVADSRQAAAELLGSALRT